MTRAKRVFLTLSLIVNISITMRTPLRAISGNRRHKTELTPYQRGIITGLSYQGCSPHEIANQTGFSRGTVRYTIDQNPKRNHGITKSRTGRPKKYTIQDERRILRIVRLDPKISYSQLKRDTGLSLSRSTFYRLLKANGIQNWIARKRPLLKEEHAIKRLAWALEHVNWTLDQWAKVIWSDECSVERGKGKRATWVFRTPSQKWDKEMIEPYPKGKQPSVMVWACFSGKKGPSIIQIMQRDENSAKNGYSANSYLQVLNDNLRDYYETDLIFMQDNAPIHKARKVKDWFIEFEIIVMDWPPYSPDLNPIEHLWAILKDKLNKLFPTSDDINLSKEEVRIKLEKAIQETWDSIENGYFMSLWMSMKKRCEAVIAAEGWHTKY